MAIELTTQTCDPLSARMWFNLRTPVNWAASIFLFMVLVLMGQSIIYPFIADIVALAIVFCLFFFLLDKRSFAIVCPDCTNYIETNTAWICGYCQEKTVQTDDFPFINRCEHDDCRQEPKAYQCHHCGKLIFLTKDKLTINYAKCVNTPDAPIPIENDETAEKVIKQQEKKRDLIHKLEVTRLKGDLKEAKSRIEVPKRKSQREIIQENFADFEDRNMTGAEIVRRKKAANAKRFKNNPEELERQNRLVDQWARDHLDLM